MAHHDIYKTCACMHHSLLCLKQHPNLLSLIRMALLDYTVTFALIALCSLILTPLFHSPLPTLQSDKAKFPLQASHT